MVMKRTRLLAAVGLAVALFAATIAVGHADESLIFGKVVALTHIEGQGYFVEVQTTSERPLVEVTEELWNQLDIGDTLRLSAGTLSLLHKGPAEPGVGAGERTK